VTRILPIVLVTLLVSVAVAGIATAGPGDTKAGTGKASKMLDRVYSFVFDTLLFRGGLIAVGVGILLWGTANKSADRATTGRRIGIGGGVCVVVSVGIQALVALPKYFAVGAG